MTRVAPRVSRNVPVPMRDGTILRADLYLPPEGDSFPILLQRTPYNKDQMHTSGLSAAGATSRGYGVVVQDVRGRYSSEGVFRPYVDDAVDGYDTVMWAASQSYSNGEVGMYGVSYMATAQLLAASQRPSPLRAIVPFQAGSSFYKSWAYEGGNFNLANRVGWTLTMMEDVGRRSGAALSREVEGVLGALSELMTATTDPSLEPERRMLLQNRVAEKMRVLFSARPLSELAFPWDQVPFLRDWIQHETYDEFWQNLDSLWDYADINVPALHIGGWYDVFLEGTLENYHNLRVRAESRGAPHHQRLIVGPWTHGDYSSKLGDVDFGESADRKTMKFTRLHLDWFDEWMRPSGESLQIIRNADARPKLFVMGEDLWLRVDSFPPADAREYVLFLQSGGSANTRYGDGTLSASGAAEPGIDSFDFEPGDPVESVGGRILGLGLVPGPRDQSAVEERADVLVYTGPVLEEAIQLAGGATCVLWVSTEVPDTAFTAKLVDVRPDGLAINVLDGIVRTTARQQSWGPETVPKDRAPTELEIWMGQSYYTFGRGHSLRLEVSSSSFPRFAVNGNSGESLLHGASRRRVTQTVHHGGDYESTLTLHVIPTGEGHEG